MCGDSTSQDDVCHLMSGAIADLVVTDPPYNVNVSNSKGMTIENDNMQSEKFYEFLSKAFSNMNLYLKEGGAFYVWYATSEHINFETALNSAGLHVRQQLIWGKINSSLAEVIIIGSMNRAFTVGKVALVTTSWMIELKVQSLKIRQ